MKKKNFLLSIAFFAIWIYLTIQTILSKYWDTLAFAVFVLTVSIVLAYIKNKFVSRIIRGILVFICRNQNLPKRNFQLTLNSKILPGKTINRLKYREQSPSFVLGAPNRISARFC